MIHKIFPIHVLVKDFDKSDEWHNNLLLALQTHYVDLCAGGDRKQLTEVPMAVFTEENMDVTPELRDLREMFIDGFWELYQSYNKSERSKIFGENMLTREEIAEKAARDLGRLPFMRKGDSKRIHNHTRCEAFGVFYMQDVNNKKDGGELILYDPAFHDLADFYEYAHTGIETKKHRLVICPGHVWHEVTQYTGDEERVTVVLNLDHFGPGQRGV